MEGRTVFKLAVTNITTAIIKALKTCNLSTNDIDYLICHQANLRIIEKIRDQLKLSEKNVLTNVQHYGNTSAASIPILLSEYKDKNTFKKGDTMILAGFGAGFTWGVNIIKWE